MNTFQIQNKNVTNFKSKFERIPEVTMNEKNSFKDFAHIFLKKPNLPSEGIGSRPVNMGRRNNIKNFRELKQLYEDRSEFHENTPVNRKISRVKYKKDSLVMPLLDYSNFSKRKLKGSTKQFPVEDGYWITRQKRHDLAMQTRQQDENYANRENVRTIERFAPLKEYRMTKNEQLAMNEYIRKSASTNPMDLHSNEALRKLYSESSRKLFRPHQIKTFHNRVYNQRASPVKPVREFRGVPAGRGFAASTFEEIDFERADIARVESSPSLKKLKKMVNPMLRNNRPEIISYKDEYLPPNPKSRMKQPKIRPYHRPTKLDDLRPQRHGLLENIKNVRAVNPDPTWKTNAYAARMNSHVGKGTMVYGDRTQMNNGQLSVRTYPEHMKKRAFVDESTPQLLSSKERIRERYPVSVPAERKDRSLNRPGMVVFSAQQRNHVGRDSNRFKSLSSRLIKQISPIERLAIQNQTTQVS